MTDLLTYARGARHGLAAFGLAALGAAAVLATTRVQVNDLTHDCALFVHLASLVVGFGAVLSVDWVALLWISGRRDLGQVLETAENVMVPIWAGYAGLVASGIVLAPNLSNPLTIIKLGLVLVIGCNGIMVSWLAPRLRDNCPRALTLSGMSALVSQLGWWGATVIGYLNAG